MENYGINGTYKNETLEFKTHSQRVSKNENKTDHEVDSKDSTKIKTVDGDRFDFKFDKATFDSELHKKLLDSLFEQNKAAKPEDSSSQLPKIVDSILYAVDEDVEATEVPEYWNAENTSQRIVDFATSFLSVFKGSSDEFYEEIKGAIKKGFEEAKGIIGDLPEGSAKLFNDTYEASMSKLDEFFEKLKNPENSDFAAQTQIQETPRLNLVA